MTIYLAAAAPFGVAHFLRRQSLRAHNSRALLKAAGVALLWPLTASRLLLERRADAFKTGAWNNGERLARQHELKIERAKRALVNSLRAVGDLLEQTQGSNDETVRHELFAARECVERYTGLTLAAAGACVDDAPSARELELCRLAGRSGDDLLLAGRCTHRRNVSRLLAHRERARVELLHAFAAVRETAHTLYSASPHSITPERRINETLLRTFALAIELHSLLDDWQAALSVSRLLDAECTRMRRCAAGGVEEAPSVTPQEGELCTTPAALKAFAGLRPPTTTLS